MHALRHQAVAPELTMRSGVLSVNGRIEFQSWGTVATRHSISHFSQDTGFAAGFDSALRQHFRFWFTLRPLYCKDHMVVGSQHLATRIFLSVTHMYVHVCICMTCATAIGLL